MQLPKKIQLSTPANQATGVSTQPLLTWVANPDAASYTIQINHTADWELIDWPASSATNSYQVQTQLTPGENYTWQVGAYDAGGRWVGSTEVSFSFTVSNQQ
jgi:hypothetical protein